MIRVEMIPSVLCDTQMIFASPYTDDYHKLFHENNSSLRFSVCDMSVLPLRSAVTVFRIKYKVI